MDIQPGNDQPPARPTSEHDAHCWVICPTQTAAPDIYTAEAGPHYSSRDEAIAAVSDLDDIPVRLPQACYVHSCDSCQEDLTDDDTGGVIHWLSPAAAAREASSTGWTSDGHAWHCPDCPGLATADELDQVAADAARQPGSQDQMLPGLGITRADVDVLGAAGVIPQQAAAYAALGDQFGGQFGDADEDGAGW